MSGELTLAEEPDLTLVARVRSSPSLSKVLRELAGTALRGMTQRLLSQAAGVSSGHMSEHLARLIELGLGECATPAVRRSKLYRATPLGRAVAGSISRLDELEASEAAVRRVLQSPGGVVGGLPRAV